MSVIIRAAGGAGTVGSSVDLTSEVTGILPVQNGGTGADLSGTGGANQVVKQVTLGGAFTVGTLASTNLSDTASIVTLTGSQTLTNKTLTSPTMTTPTLGAASATTIQTTAGTSGGGVVHLTMGPVGGGRWKVILTGTESGANTGSNLGLFAYDDSSAFIAAPLNIVRATGSIGLGRGNTSPSGALSTLDATPTTGATIVWIGHDGSGTYTSSHLSAVSTVLNVVAGSAQSGDLQTWKNASGSNLARIASDGSLFVGSAQLASVGASLYGVGSFYVTGSVGLPSAGVLSWSSGGTSYTSIDTTILRISAGVVGVGTAGAGHLQLTHLIGKGTAPTITAGGGSSPSIAGSDLAFRVTVGTGGVDSSVTITFGTAFTTAPVCIAGEESTSLLLKAVATTTTVTISAATPFSAADKIVCHCIGY